MDDIKEIEKGLIGHIYSSKEKEKEMNETITLLKKQVLSLEKMQYLMVDNIKSLENRLQSIHEIINHQLVLMNNQFGERDAV